MPSGTYISKPFVPAVYDSPNLIRLAELARAAGYTRAEQAHNQGIRQALGWSKLGDVVIAALNGISQDKDRDKAIAMTLAKQQADRAQHEHDFAATQQLERDKLAQEAADRAAQREWQQQQFRSQSADAAADVMIPGQAVTPEQFSQRFAGTPSEVRFAHDPARPAMIPARELVQTGGVPGYSTTDTDSIPLDVMQRPGMSSDVAARPERYTRQPLFTETMAAQNLQRQEEAARAAAESRKADDVRADEAAKSLEKFRAAQLKLRQQSNAIAEGKADKANAAPDVSQDVRTTFNGMKYIDLGDYETPTERQKARDAAKKAGVPALAKDVAAGLTAADTARQNMGAMMAQIESKLPKDAAGRLLAGPENQIAKFLQTDDDIASFKAWRGGAIQALQAIVERGMGFRLNKAEIDMIMQNDIPQLSDTVGTARKRLKALTTMLDNKEKSALTMDRSTLNPALANAAKKNPF